MQNTMNTLIFLSGVGVGAFVGSVIVLIILCLFIRLQKKGAKSAEDHYAATEECMRERNALDARKVAALDRIAREYKGPDFIEDGTGALIPNPRRKG